MHASADPRLDKLRRLALLYAEAIVALTPASCRCAELATPVATRDRIDRRDVVIVNFARATDH